MSAVLRANASKTIGVLGGMGPYASCAFLKTLLDKTRAEKDSDHLRVVLDSNPHIPSRTRAVLYGEESPLDGMAEACARLCDYPVDAIALPCNSAAAWIEPLRERVSVPVLDIIEITSDALQRVFQGSSRVAAAVWGGRVTYKLETYRRHIEKKGYMYTGAGAGHSDDIQSRIDFFISEIKLNRLNDALFKEINALGEYFVKVLKVDCVILGCTEFGCLSPDIFGFPFVNSLARYAEYIVEYAKQ